MKRFFLFVLLFSAGAVSAEEFTAAFDKQDEYRRSGTIVSRTEPPTSSGVDVQGIRWHQHDQYFRVVLDFHQLDYLSAETPRIARAPYYRVHYETHPYRFVFEISARRASALERDKSVLKETPFLSDIYAIPTFDDAAIRLAMELDRPVEFELFELDDPGAMTVLDLKEVEEQPAPRFSVRSQIFKNAEEALVPDENLLVKHDIEARWLKTAGGGWCLEAGLFETREAAETAAQKWAFEGVAWQVEERGPAERPQD